jgi:hypothetical protein
MGHTRSTEEQDTPNLGNRLGIRETFTRRISSEPVLTDDDLKSVLVRF